MAMKFINLVVAVLLFAQPLMAADPGEEGAALAASAGIVLPPPPRTGAVRRVRGPTNGW